MLTDIKNIHRLAKLTMNRTLTKQKDTDKMVLSLLEDKDLVNLCIASPNFWFYLDGDFWKEMLQKKYPT